MNMAWTVIGALVGLTALTAIEGIVLLSRVRQFIEHAQQLIVIGQRNSEPVKPQPEPEPMPDDDTPTGPIPVIGRHRKPSPTPRSANQ